MSINARISQQYNQPKHNPLDRTILYIILFVLTLMFIGPLLFTLSNSFKDRFPISDAPFALPLGEYWPGLDNYFSGLETTNFFVAAGQSLFITVGSVTIIVFFCTMTVYYITRVKTEWMNALYLLLVFSMIVPSQMVMFPTVKPADILNLDNSLGMILLYLGFGSGLSVFIFSSFVESIPIEIEEASMVDGRGPLQNYFHIVMPMLKSVMIAIATLNMMWVWSDYLLPYLMIGLSAPYKTTSVIVQQLVSSHNFNGMGALMAMFVPAIILIVTFYLFSQKYTIEGVVVGAVKG